MYVVSVLFHWFVGVFEVVCFLRVKDNETTRLQDCDGCVGYSLAVSEVNYRASGLKSSSFVFW